MMKNLTGNNIGKVLPIILLAVLLVLPMIIRGPYYLHIILMTFLWIALSSAWNIIGGMGGQLSIGHAAFFGIGAYTSSLLQVNFGITPWLGMIAGGLLSVVVARIISAPALRLRGPFFTLTTIAFAEVIRLLANHFRDLTRGSVGLSVPFRPGFENLAFRGKEPYYYIFLAFMVLVIVICYLVQHSKLGFYLSAVREDEDAAESLGVPCTRTKLTAMLISAFFTSVGGTLFAQYQFYIDPHTVFPIHISIQMVLMAAIGGMGMWQGPVLGGFILVPAGELLRAWFGSTLRGLHFAIYGLVLMLVVIFIPGGLFPWLRDQFKSLSTGKAGRKQKDKQERRILDDASGS